MDNKLRFLLNGDEPCEKAVLHVKWAALPYTFGCLRDTRSSRLIRQSSKREKISGRYIVVVGGLDLTNSLGADKLIHARKEEATINMIWLSGLRRLSAIYPFFGEAPCHDH